MTEPNAAALLALEHAPAPYDAELQAAGQFTSPTWELELFLSGAFVFSSFQLPGVVESVFRRLEPHMTDAGSLVLFDAVLYAKAIAFTLIFTFLIHLVSRAYWVGLLGLQSVFPGGIRWDEMKTGPIAKDLYRERVPPLTVTIARIDNFCSIVFSAGLLIVVMFAYSTALAALAGGTSYGLALLFSNGEGVRYYVLGTISLFALVPLAGTFADKRFGPRLAVGSRQYRIVRRLVYISLYVSIMRLVGPLMWTIATNVGRKKSTAFMIATMMSLMVLSTADRLVQSDRMSFNSYDFFGASREHEVRYQVYENQRDPDESYSRVPSIQSDIIRDPYVRLFIPYNPPRHNAAIARSCPAVKALQARGFQIGSDPLLPDSLVVPALSCIEEIHAVSLDGMPLATFRLAFYEHPGSGIKGMIGYIPVDSLRPGRHVIGLLPVPPVDLPTDSTVLANASWKKPTLISFWR